MPKRRNRKRPGPLARSKARTAAKAKAEQQAAALRAKAERQAAALRAEAERQATAATTIQRPWRSILRRRATRAEVARVKAARRVAEADRTAVEAARRVAEADRRAAAAIREAERRAAEADRRAAVAIGQAGNSAASAVFERLGRTDGLQEVMGGRFRHGLEKLDCQRSMKRTREALTKRPSPVDPKIAETVMAESRVAEWFESTINQIMFWWYLLLLEVCEFPHSGELQDDLVDNEDQSTMSMLMIALPVSLDKCYPGTPNEEFRSRLSFDSARDFEISFRSAVRDYLTSRTPAMVEEVSQTLAMLNEVDGLVFNPLTDEQRVRLERTWRDQMIPVLSAFLRIEFQRVYRRESRFLERTLTTATGAGASTGAGAGADPASVAAWRARTVVVEPPDQDVFRPYTEGERNELEVALRASLADGGM